MRLGSLISYLSCVPETQPEADMCLRVPWILVVRRGEGLGEMELELWWTVETPCRRGSFASASCVFNCRVREEHGGLPQCHAAPVKVSTLSSRTAAPLRLRSEELPPLSAVIWMKHSGGDLLCSESCGLPWSPGLGMQVGGACRSLGGRSLWPAGVEVGFAKTP